MSAAILFLAGIALLLAGASGFRGWWKESLLISTLAWGAAAGVHHGVVHLYRKLAR